MKIPLEWLKQYVAINKTAFELASSFTFLGLLLDKPIEKSEFGNEILDLEHRMDRADWLGIIGCARDLAAFENVSLKMPEMHTQELAMLPEKEKVKITVKDKGFVNRFYTRVIYNVKVKESPEWLKKRLIEYGMVPINNIVDITNYVMVELGQPLHAHDLNKMETREITFRKAIKGESITTLLGESITLDEDITILSTNDKPTIIGGIVGGEAVAIDQSTTDILLDSGSYDQTSVRKNSRKLKIINETVQRYDKFLHPYNNKLAIDRATKLILDIAGGEAYENGDYFPDSERWLPRNMRLRYDRILKIGGLLIEKDKIKQILTNLDYKILKEEEETLVLEVPYFRTDVCVEDDIVSDVLRIYGFSNIPMSQITTAPPKEITPISYVLEERMRDTLCNMGLHEHSTDPLVPSDPQNKQQVKLVNALTEEKAGLRYTIKETLKPVLEHYTKLGLGQPEIFEIGKIYALEGDPKLYKSYKEIKALQVLTTLKNGESVLALNKRVKQILASLFVNLNIDQKEYELQNTKEKISQETPEESSKITKTTIVARGVEVGELLVDSFVLYTEELSQALKENLEVANKRLALHNANVMDFDITVVCKENTPLGPVLKNLEKIAEVNRITILDVYQDNESLKSATKAVTIRIYSTSQNAEELQRIKNLVVEEITRVEGLRTKNLTNQDQEGSWDLPLIGIN